MDDYFVNLCRPELDSGDLKMISNTVGIFIKCKELRYLSLDVYDEPFQGFLYKSDSPELRLIISDVLFRTQIRHRNVGVYILGHV